MSPNMFNEDDEPLFLSEENDGQAKRNNSGKTASPLSLEEYNSKQENTRKNKVLSFCFKASIWILFFAAFLIIADFIAQANKWESTLIKDCLSLVTYTVTAALGFMFGSNSK